MSEPQTPISSSSEGDGDDQEPSMARAVAVTMNEGLCEEGSSARTDLKQASSSDPSRPSLHVQKRRRVTRACDECRRKKIKCDGTQPCTHCTAYSYECTYNQPSHRRRNPAPQYIQSLESRLQRAETLLRTLFPDVDLDDPNLATAVMQQVVDFLKAERSPGEGSTQIESLSALLSRRREWGREQESVLESMIDHTGSLDLDDEGFWGFHGHSSGLVYLRRVRKHFGDLIGHPADHCLPSLQTRNLVLAFDVSRSGGDSPDPLLLDRQSLPDQDIARGLCENALDDACASFPVIHKPTFYDMLDRIYSMPLESFGNDEHRFLPLVYALMALGCLFAKAEHSALQLQGYGGAIDQGFRWLKLSRQLMDITDCRDLTSLQTILVMTFFLQASAKLSTCYSYIGIAVTSSLRMGLHRSVPVTFNPVEHEVRKRVFWTIRKLDIYVGALLGLPEILSDDNINQEMPLEVDDEFITVDQILPMPPGRISSIAAFNAHTRLVYILAKTVKYIYPTKGLVHVSDQATQPYAVNHARIREIEQDLRDWMEKLPMALRPGGDSPPQLVRMQQNLRITYAHLQMFLYRPFLHYASTDSQSQNIDARSFACAATCVDVCRTVIHVTGDMKRRGLLISWFYMYTTFFAIMTLVFFVLENPSSPTTADILRDAYEGKDTLASFARRSMAADRCTITLKPLFEQLPERLDEAGIPNILPNPRNTHMDDTRALPSSSPITSEDSSRPIHGAHVGVHAQPSTLERDLEGSPEHQPSERHRVTTFADEANSHVTENYLHMLPQNYFRPADTAVSPTLSRAPNRGPADTIPPSMTASPTFGSMSFAGDSTSDFSATDPKSGSEQSTGFIACKNPIKVEDDQDRGWYDRFSTITESDTSHVQVFGVYPSYPMPGQHDDVHVEAQYVHTWADPSDQKAWSQMAVPIDGADRGWTGHHARSETFPGMNPHNPTNPEWGSSWIYQGY